MSLKSVGYLLLTFRTGYVLSNNKSVLMNTTRPLEVIYFFAFPSQTIKDGIIYTFLAIDDYSEFLMLLGTSNVLNSESITESIINFTQHKDFLAYHKGEPFTLYLPFDKNEIKNNHLYDELLKPLNGKMEYDLNLVVRKSKPVVDSFFEMLKKQG